MFNKPVERNCPPLFLHEGRVVRVPKMKSTAKRALLVYGGVGKNEHKVATLRIEV